MPDDGEPPVALQENVTVPVPPLEEAVQFTIVPTVPVAGQLMVTIRAAAGLMTIVAVIIAVLLFPSVSVTLTV